MQNAALNITNKEAPVKKKHNWNNQSAFIKKEIRKAIMIRSRSLNKFFGEKAWKQASIQKTKKLCVSLVRKTKNDFFNNLNVKYITDKKTFLKVVKPYFSNKSTRNKKITLV